MSERRLSVSPAECSCGDCEVCVCREETLYASRLSVAPAYIQCVCPKHGPTTWLHRDAETDDFCLLPVVPAKAAAT